jgi:integrase-like protein
MILPAWLVISSQYLAPVPPGLFLHRTRSIVLNLRGVRANPCRSRSNRRFAEVAASRCCGAIRFAQKAPATILPTPFAAQAATAPKRRRLCKQPTHPSQMIPRIGKNGLMKFESLRRHYPTQTREKHLSNSPPNTTSLRSARRTVHRNRNRHQGRPHSASSSAGLLGGWPFRSVGRNRVLPRVRFHDLRHSHATHLLASDVHPKIAQERLGHASIGTTLDLYSHVLPGMQADAANRVDAALRAALDKHRSAKG